MVCTHAVLEMKKNNRNIPTLPIAAAIAVRLAALHSQQQAHQPHQQTQTDGAKEDAFSPFFGSSNTKSNNFSNSWEPCSCPALHPMVNRILTFVQILKCSIYCYYLYYYYLLFQFIVNYFN